MNQVANRTKNDTVPSPSSMNPSAWRERSTQIAMKMLTTWVGEARAREAAGRLATALSASAASAKNPSDFYACTEQSIAKVVALQALTGIMVSSGQGALAYAIPRRPRKGEAPQLQYQLSHRGLAALAKRAAMSLIAIPISTRDVIDADETGEVVVKSRNFDEPPASEEDFRGVMVLVKSITSGAVIARGFVPKSVINVRRASSDSYTFAEKPGNSWAKDSSPWHAWYVEMAMKTAMHYAIGRAWCVIDDTEAVRALQADAESDYVPSDQTLLGEGQSKTDVLTDRLLGESVDADGVTQVKEAGDEVQGSSPLDQ